MTNPIIVDEEGNILAGQGRYAAARLLGMEEVPTILLANMTRAQKRAYIITDNRLADLCVFQRPDHQSPFKLIELAPGVTAEEVAAKTTAHYVGVQP